MEKLIKSFDNLNQEQKIQFMKKIMPKMCKIFEANPKKIMNEIMPVCQDMMKNSDMDMMKMMSMMENQN